MTPGERETYDQDDAWSGDRYAADRAALAWARHKQGQSLNRQERERQLEEVRRGRRPPRTEQERLEFDKSARKGLLLIIFFILCYFFLQEQDWLRCRPGSIVVYNAGPSQDAHVCPDWND